MNDPMNTGGRWPAVKPARIILYDFIHRRPMIPAETFVDDMQHTGPLELSGVYYGDPYAPGIPFEVLLVAIVLAGVMIGGCGYMVSVGWVDAWNGARLIACFVGGFVVRLMLETR